MTPQASLKAWLLRVFVAALFVWTTACSSDETTFVYPTDGDSAETELADQDGDSAENEQAEREDAVEAPDGDGAGDECQVDEDCSSCRVCTSLEGVKRCLATPGPRPECTSAADCPEGSRCQETRPGCGGSCTVVAAGDYTLHEWGVNVVKTTGARLSSAPPRFYGAVPAKPVIYIYGKQPFTLNVGVRFKAGVARETWPELPSAQNIAWNNIQVTQGDCALSPTPQAPEYGSAASPVAPDKEIYDLANWIVPQADCLKVGDVRSRLLFYSGDLPSYSSPLSFSYTIDAAAQTITFSAKNQGSEALSNVLLLYRDAWGDCIDPSLCSLRHVVLGFTRLSTLAPGATQKQTVALSVLNSEAESFVALALPAEWQALSKQFKSDSVALGLSTDEAEKLVAAWDETFFGVHHVDARWYLPDYQLGAFALFPWSQSRAAEQLALTLNPQPKDEKRVIWEWLSQPIPFSSAQEGSVSGQVSLHSVSGMPEDPGTTSAAPNARVAAYKDGLLFATTKSDEKAHYSLTLPEGPYTLLATRLPGEASKDVPLSLQGSMTQDLLMEGSAVVDKPNLYLYPTQTTRVKVTLDLAPKRRITQSIPAYGTGWDVLAEPSGLLDGRYTYLFYEAEVPASYHPSSGWSVPAAELTSFFTRILDEAGLTAAEKKDFIDYWPSHLPAAAHYLVYPLERRQIEAMVGLTISPAPDTLARLWWVVVPTTAPRSLPAPRLSPFQRQGFSALEWGVIVQGR